MHGLYITLITFGVAIFSAPSFSAEKPPINVLILSGQNNHDWKTGSREIKTILEKTGRFHVTVTEKPETLTPTDLENIDVIVSNWTTFSHNKPVAVSEWSPVAQHAILDFVRNGKGHVVVHAGGSSFYDWSDYQRMIGGASWKIGISHHAPLHVFQIRPTPDSNPIAKDIGIFYTHDELWNDTGFNKDVTVVAEAFSAKEHKGPNRWEPVATTNSFGKGRNFALVLGHDTASMANPGFRALLARGTEWAATGHVHIPVPKDIPHTAKSAESLFKHAGSAGTDSPRSQRK